MHNLGELIDLYQSVIRAAQNPPRDCELTYLIGQTRDNQASVLNRAATLPGLIAVPGFEELESTCDFAGAKAWQAALKIRRVAPDRIVSLPGTLVSVGEAMSFNAYSEQIDLVCYAKEKGYTKVAFVAPYWQVLRSFMGAVAACSLHYKKLRVYPILGASLPWDEKAKHSQGKLVGARVDFMFTETARIFEYHKKGDLPSASDALIYLDWMLSEH